VGEDAAAAAEPADTTEPVEADNEPADFVPKPAAKRTAAAEKSSAGKTISHPRNAPPSRFDSVQDE
jgi:hypothetical protein